MKGTTGYGRAPNDYDLYVQYDTCPGWNGPCGRRKSTRSTLCNLCNNRRVAAARYPEDVTEMLDRHRRFEAALDQGYRVDELMHLARRGRLPTWEQLGVEETAEASP